MSTENKAMELQLQVRQNARDYQNSVKDLYSWEKEIKSKEQAMQNAPAPPVQLNASPVRSHVTNTDETLKKASTKESPSSSATSTPTEKQDFPTDALAHQHKKANDIKDRGNNYVKQAEYDRAIEAYTEAIDIYAQDPIYFINRALCYLKQERFENCIEDCEAAITLDKLCVKAYYRRMQANESLGNNMEALKDCTTVLAIDPKNFEAKKSLERINNRLRKIATKNGPNFTENRDDFIDILPFDKPAYKRSNQPMRRVPVVDIVSPRPNQDEQKQLRISDDEIDKIFNSNCGPFEEVKSKSMPKSVTLPNFSEMKEKLNEKIQATKQADKKSTIIEEMSKSLEKPIEAALKDSVKAEEIPNIKKPLEMEAKMETVMDTNRPLKSANEKMETIKSNIVQNSTESNAQGESATSALEERVPPAPAGTAQFYITWKELSPNQKYKYLKSIEIPNLSKILGAGFDSDTFTDLLRTLKNYYVPNKEPTTAAVLLEISKNDEFTILSMLFSQEEKTMIGFIMDAIKKFPKSNPELLAKLGKAYNVA